MTIIDEKWRKEKWPNVKVRDIHEILEADKTLDITAVDGDSIPYVGWVEATFKLASDEVPAAEVIVPILVMRGSSLARPIGPTGPTL